ncbi:MAG: hypothetical protein IGS03_05205 [Candidatus Sericytochromatia bacterium]|nr:hypothetical protein [Candidatus Sericytochromatia bacterium]
MPDGDIKIGSHDTGFWDASNPIQASKKPLASDLSVEAALTKAQQTEGAELVVVNADGKASVHALSVEDSFLSENKKVLVSELDRDPKARQDLGKTPLAIDDKVAQALSGKGAFLVDATNKVTYLGDDVDQTTAAVKLRDAESYLAQPTAARVEAAYAIARDAGQERHVDTALAGRVLDQLHQDYRRTEPAQAQVDLLKPGSVKTRMTGLIGDLSTLSGQESSRVSDLRGQLSERTSQWQNDLKAPTQQRDAALSAWQTADRREAQAVSTAAYQLREARMPGVHQLEGQLDEARGQRDQLRTQLSRATENRVQAQSRVNELERLPTSAENRLAQARQLESENQSMYIQIQSYTTLTLSQVSSQRRELERDYRQTETELDIERSKPRRPSSGGGSSNDPYGKDPFSSSNSIGSDPYGKDPFADSRQYRNEGRISDLERQLSRLGRERNDLRDREDSLETVNTRLAFTRDIDQLSLLFYNLDPIDRLALNQYKERKDRNVRSINEHRRSAESDQSRYRREIGGAQRSLAEASSSEEAARSRFGQAEGRVAGLEQDLQQTLASPRPDSHPEVKPKATAYERALAHQTATVGPEAPLTQRRDSTQAALNSLNQSYSRDKAALEDQIANVQRSLRQEAQGKVAQTRQQLP